jgi:hypothetical protein
LAPAVQRESPAAPPEKKQALHFGGTPAREAQRLNPPKNDTFQIIGQGRERQAREPMRPAETRPAQREVRRADPPVQQGPPEMHRQPVKEGRKVEVKPQAPSRTQQAGTGQEATRADAAKTGNAVKAATPAPRAQAAAGHQEGGNPGQAGKTGGFGMR